MSRRKMKILYKKKKKKKKKKKFINIGDQSVVYNGRKETFSEMSPTISGSEFQGLNLENNFEFNDQRGLFGARAAFYSNLAGGAEVVAVHRKINPKSGRNVLMEHEFFPDKNVTFFKETRFQNPAGSSNGQGKPPFCLTTCDYSNSPSNSVDLSPELSF